MYKYITLLCLSALSLSATAQTTRHKPVVKPSTQDEVQEQSTRSPVIFTFVQQMPSFPGDSLNKYLAANTHYPKEAEKEGVEGRVYIRMIIRKDGSVDNVEIIRSTANKLLDAEALRVVRSMPKWVPGKQNGQAVNVYYTLPIVFRLQ